MGFPTNIGKVFVKTQASGWGTEETSFAAADLISAKTNLPKVVMEALKSESFRGGWHSFPIEPGSRQGATTTIEHIPQGPSLTTPAANPSDYPEAILLASLMGAQAAIGYTSGLLSASGQTTSAIKFTDTTLATTWAGMAMIATLVGGAREIVWGKTIDIASSPDVFTPWFTMAAAVDPTGTPKTYGGRVCWDSLTQPTPFTVQTLLGQSDGAAAIRLRDAVCNSAKFTLEAGKQPQSSYGILAGYWSPAGTWTVAPYTVQYPELPALFGANGARVKYAGAATIFPKVEIEFTADMQAVSGLGQTDAFAKFICVDRDCTITITELLTAYGTGQNLPGTEVATGMQIDFCTIPGRAISMFFPTYQVLAVWEDEDASGFAVRKTKYGTRPTAVETAGANAANSCRRVALL